MNNRLFFDKSIQAILLFNSTRECWEDKSESITAMYKHFYYGNHTGYDIYFRGGSGKFFYPFQKVKMLSKTKTVDIRKQDVFVDEQQVNALQVDAFEQGYFRVKSPALSYFSNRVRFRSNQYRMVFRYFQSLARYAAGVAEENTPLSILSQRYLRLDDEVPESVLLDYLQGVLRPLSPRKRLILPFDFNQSQMSAISAATHCSISVIEGPPGTGKTQTILNLK